MKPGFGMYDFEIEYTERIPCTTTRSRWYRRTDRTTARCNRPDFLEFSYKIPKNLIAPDNDSRISLEI